MKSKTPHCSSFLAIALSGLPAAVGCGPTEPSGEDSVVANENEELSLPIFDDGSRVEVVFQAIRVLDGAGNVVSSEERGHLTLATFQRAARPWTHLGEPYVYHQESWERARDEGTTEAGYRVLRTPNRAAGPPPPAPGQAARLGRGVAERAAGAAPVDVILRLADYPRWDVPLVPSSPYLTEEDRQAGHAEREAAFEARQAGFTSRSAGVRAALEHAGAEVKGLGWGSGWILARVPPEALRQLTRRKDLARIDLVEGGAQEQQAQEAVAYEAGTGAEEAAWNTGDGLRAGRFDADRFLFAGYNGETANPSRHTYGDIVVGVNELRVFEDEGCYLADGAGCTSTSRVREKLTCDGTVEGNRCSTIADFADLDEPGSQAQPVVCCDDQTPCSGEGWECSQTGVPVSICGSTKACACVDDTCARHGTNVTSIILGDYTGGQADTLAVGDDSCPGGCVHTSTFKRRGTGVAPEASLVFWGRHRPAADPLEQADSLASAFMGAMTRNVDILNNSWVWRSALSDCDPVVREAFEDDAENAYDDGIFVVAAAGNTPFTSGCDVGSPADLPKVFAVNGMPTTAVGCDTSYSSCLVNSNHAATGGAPATTPISGTHSGALSIIAAAAPTNLEYTTTELGTYGEVDDSATVFRAGGSSMAAAFVSGLAADVKSLYLARGDTTINDPGRLYTVMLAMTDRHSAPPGSSSSQHATGSHNDWGFGRIKLRRFGNQGAKDADGAAGTSWLYTQTTTSLGAISYWDAPAPFATPLPTGTSLAKCVLLQEEDMSDGKITVSDVNLTVEIQEPAPGPGQCNGTGTGLATQSDTSYDIKSMVAITGDLGAKCLKVTADVVELATSQITFHIMCYTSSVNDDARLPDADNDGIADIDEIVQGTCRSGTDTGCAGSCATPQSSLAKTTDTDCDGITDEAEVAGLTDPTTADTDGDGTNNDNTDFEQRANWQGQPSTNCTTRTLNVQLTGPISTTTSTALQPAVTWTNGANADLVHLDLCENAGCTTVLQTNEFTTGNTWTPGTNLPKGNNFAQLFARQGADIACPRVRQFFVAAEGVAAGDHHTCAITRDGSAKCWGTQNAEGRLGDNLTTPSMVPVIPQGLTSEVQSLAAGTAHTCAVMTDATVKCWGDNVNGQLGIGTFQSPKKTPQLLAGFSASSLAAGGHHTCAVTSGGAKCWGANGSGQVGDGTTSNRKSPTNVSGLSSNVIVVASGSLHNCALTAPGGGVKCWGHNGFGQVGIGNTASPQKTPVDVSGLTAGVAAVSAGQSHTCALLTGTGGIKCWGQNAVGQLGDGTNTLRNQPVAVVEYLGGPELTGIRAIMTGMNYTCAVTASGGLKCWGSNLGGQLGDGTTTQSWWPVDVVGYTTAGISAASGGDRYACALRATGLSCWGANSYIGFGQLGTGDTVPSLTPAIPIAGL